MLAATSCYAQPTPLDPTNLSWNNTNLANILSDVSVGLSITGDTINSWKQEDRKHAFIKQGERTVVVLGATELVKLLVHRERPDHSDDLSFYSEHTAFSALSFTGPRFVFVLPLTVSTGYLRIAANKHYLTDTLVGAIAGGLAGKFIR